MQENAHIQVVDSSRRCEQEPSISGTFVRLNVLDYNRAEQSDQIKRIQHCVNTSCVFECCENLTNKG